MKLKRFSIGTLGLLAVSGLAWSCSGKSDDCKANLDCAPFDSEVSVSGASGTSGKGGGGSGSSSGAGGASGTSGESGTDSAAGTGGAAPPTCDGTLSPDADVCVISDEYGVFVSPAGPSGEDPAADGTQAHPYSTVTNALTHIKLIKHVYVCASDYEEPSTLEIPDRVSIYGGFTCEGGTWKYDSSLPAHLLPKSPIGAMLTDAKVGVVLQDVRIDAANAPDDGTGASSFGLISNSSTVILRHVEIKAGKGGKGTNGKSGTTGANGLPPLAQQNGADARCSGSTPQPGGIADVQSVCGSVGGNGGTAYLSLAGGSGSPGTPTDHLSPPGVANGGPGATDFGTGYPGTAGGFGFAGIAGVRGIGATSVGVFTATGYKSASGGDGTDGYPGQGGGGGGASMGNGTKMPTPGVCFGASGGSGGMGGCGGQAGRGGGGGGASVALVAWNGSVTIVSTVLVTSAGGAGGLGGDAHEGGAGAAGGTGGLGSTTSGIGDGGSGGKGGSGGNGGNGAGGTGGPSVGIVWHGTAPATSGVTFKLADGGALGKGGHFGDDDTAWGPDGSPGLKQNIYP